jgi:hypothetical protein
MELLSVNTKSHFSVAGYLLAATYALGISRFFRSL